MPGAYDSGGGPKKKQTVPDDCLGEGVTATDKGGCEPGKQPDNQTNHCRRYNGRQALHPLEEIQKADDGGVVCSAQQPQQGSGNQVVGSDAIGVTAPRATRKSGALPSKARISATAMADVTSVATSRRGVTLRVSSSTTNTDAPIGALKQQPVQHRRQPH